MPLMPYRLVLALPGVRRLMLVGLVTRIPATAIGMALTLHVVTALGRSYASAGLVTAAYTIGTAIGSPLVGRLVDRRGARPAIVLTAVAQTACWLAAPRLPYPGLVAVAGLGGLLALPVWGIVRQSLAALVPEDRRRPAFALDSMSVELSFMAGPAAAVALTISLPAGAGLDVIAAGVLLSGVLLYLADPMTMAEHETVSAVPPPRRSWLRLPVVAVMLAVGTSTFVLAATELTIVASLRLAAATSWTGLVIALWCAYSLLGGLAFGLVRRPVPVLALTIAMSLLTIPVGLVTDWRFLCLALIPAGALCAPTHAAGNDTLSRLVPAESRGEAMGLLGSALTTGVSLGAPFAGVVLDSAGPGWAFAATGVVGSLAAVLSIPAYRRRAAAPATGGPATGGPATEAERVPATA
jgi:MFS family permease